MELTLTLQDELSKYHVIYHWKTSSVLNRMEYLVSDYSQHEQ